VTGYFLCGYLSPVDEPPTFLIPIFSRHGSNDCFVQDLTTSGIVKEFQLVKPSLFHSVPLLPPQLSVNVGNEGILAYWLDVGKVTVASASNMAEVLADEDTPPDPFAELEVADLLGDAGRAEAAIEEIADLLPKGSGERWRQRERKALLFRQGQKASLPELPPRSANDIEFDALINDPDKKGWVEAWTKLWRENFKRQDLAKVAFWWTDLSPRPSEGQARILILLMNQNDDLVRKYALEWINRNTLESANWPQLWTTLYHNSPPTEQPALVRTAITNLAHPKSLSSRYIANWALVWSWCWTRGGDTHQLYDIANLFDSRRQTTSQFYVERVLVALLYYAPAEQFASDRIRQWLDSSMLSNLLWANLYIRLLGKYFSDEPYARMGLKWLNSGGGNMNKWYEVWTSLKDKFGRSLLFSVGMGWLRRSRWDLATWPAVFEEVAALAESEEDRSSIIRLAEYWRKYSDFPRYKVRRIERALERFAESSQ